ncbi:MAG: 2-amino-4-hydroxy-6-hydroxymethyldihydropteridine diphosphokinase [Leptonema sp. (in: bacteria)]
MQKIIDLRKHVPFVKKHKALLSLGSNIEPRMNYLKHAKELIEKNIGIILKSSSILDNPAEIYLEQPNFLNQIIEIETFLTPIKLLSVIKKIEKEIGRKERFRYGPREIDIDILFYEKQKFVTNELMIPHPAVSERKYLKILLKEFDLKDYE